MGEDLKTLRMCKSNGFVLLITLALITVLLALTFSLHRSGIRAYVRSSLSGKRAILHAMAESGIRLGMAILIRDKTESEIDSIQECWADGECLKKHTEALAFDEGEVRLSIEDEQGKLQINALVTGQNGNQFHPAGYAAWSRFLQDRAKNLQLDIDAEEIVDSLKDWMDAEDDDRITGAKGAESAYYMGLPHPYPCKNAAVDDIRELLRVRGISSELFYGKPDHPGMVSFITACSEKLIPGRFGRININTAKPEILRLVLPESREYLAEEMAAYRSARSAVSFVHDLSDPLWYKQVPGLADVAIPVDWICLASDLFTISTTARIDAATVSITARVLREKDPKSGGWGCRIITWESDR